MKVTRDILGRYTRVPSDAKRLRDLLDDVGLEVKRSHIDANSGDVRLTLELLANRGDHHAYVGLAREIRGRTGGELRIPEAKALRAGDSPWPLVLESERCPRYSITMLERGDHDTLAGDALAVLDAAEIHSIGTVVDVTNIVNLEFGQPMHAFDADKIAGPITIRESRAGERAWPLFEEQHIDLPTGTLVIADDDKILAIAGVIGCEDSKTTDATRRVLLESAAFDPVAVRQASRALNIFTDSSARFERGSDAELVLIGAGRAVTLLEAAGWRHTGASGVVGNWQDPERTIDVDLAAANEFLATAMDRDELCERLARYGFTTTASPLNANGVNVRVPTHRLWDVEYPADLYEELAKSIGYNETPISLPPVDMGALPTANETMRVRVEEVLLGQGFYEVITDGFYGSSIREQLGLDASHELWTHVNTTNALDRAYSFLKNNALGQAVQAVSDNLRVVNPEIKAYEWTRTFHPDAAAANGICSERHLLWGIASGTARPKTWAGAERPADIYFLKGVVAEIARALDVPLTFGPPLAEHPLHQSLHPNRQLTVRLADGIHPAVGTAGSIVGIIGEVHGRVLRNFKIKRERPVYFELDERALESAPQVPRYVEPPVQHPVLRDLAFTLPHRQDAGEIAKLLEARGPEWLTRVAIVDRFDHEEDGQAVRTITFQLRYSNEPQTRTADEINGASEALIAAVIETHGARGVKLR